jgi:hypothetical protein
MRRFRSWPRMALVVALGVMNGGCVLIPELEDRIVELAVGGTTVVEFTSSGTLNTYDETNTVNVLDGFDLGQILADAGIDPSELVDIALSGVDYRVTVPDPEAGRQIVNGNVTIARDGGAPLTLISGFNAAAGAVTDWLPVPLDPGGAAVADINGMLNEIQTALPNNPPANRTTITYHLSGDSVPGNVGTNFTWEMKIKITIIGRVQVTVPT